MDRGIISTGRAFVARHSEAPVLESFTTRLRLPILPGESAALDVPSRSEAMGLL